LWIINQVGKIDTPKKYKLRFRVTIRFKYSPLSSIILLSIDLLFHLFAMSLAAVGQFCASSAVPLNKKICRDLISQAARLGAKVSYYLKVNHRTSTMTSPTHCQF
jgi:hypothetical protein